MQLIKMVVNNHFLKNGREKRKNENGAKISADRGGNFGNRGNDGALPLKGHNGLGEREKK